MTNKGSFNKGLLTIVVPLIRPYYGFISHGGTLHGGRLTGHEIWKGKHSKFYFLTNKKTGHWGSIYI